MEFLEKHIDDIEWDWSRISKNPSLTMEFLEKHLLNPRIRWDRMELSKNPSLTMDFVEKHLHDIQWVWREINEKMSLSAEVLENYILDPRTRNWWEFSRFINLNPKTYFDITLVNFIRSFQDQDVTLERILELEVNLNKLDKILAKECKCKEWRTEKLNDKLFEFSLDYYRGLYYYEKYSIYFIEKDIDEGLLDFQ